MISRGRSCCTNRRLASVLAAVLILAGVFLAVLTPTATAQEPPKVSVEVTPSLSGVRDGQVVQVRLATRADYSPVAVEVAICRPDVPYVTVADFDRNGPGKCAPGNGFSSSGLNRACFGGCVGESTEALHQPGGVSISFTVTAGVATWKAAGFTDTTLTCDESHPCWLVVRFRDSFQSSAVEYMHFPVTYLSSDPLKACGGPAAGILDTGGSDRMKDDWTKWTVAECIQPGVAPGAPTRANFSGENLAVNLFAGGALDVAYSGYGYDDAAGWAPGDRRPAVAVPVALGAAVVAVGGGHRIPGGIDPFKDIKLTAEEATRIVSNGPSGISTDQADAIVARNPELAAAPNNNARGGFGANRSFATADDSSATLAMTSYLAHHEAAPWQASAGMPRGSFSSMATADPEFNLLVVNLVSGQPNMLKSAETARAQVSETGGDGRPVFFVTDLATAEAVGLTPVQIQFVPDGPFIGPTSETMAAAVPTMKRDSFGLLVPDSQAAPAAGAYPWTFVEHALVPKEPLVAVDDSGACVARSDSQQLLDAWLRFVTGPGQALLPAARALPPALRDQAVSAISEVGSAPVSGPCAPADTGGSDGAVATAGAAEDSASGGDFNSGSDSSSFDDSGFDDSGFAESDSAALSIGLDDQVTDPDSASSSTDGSGSDKPAVAAEVVPDFAGGHFPPAAVAALALVGLTLLSVLGASVASGRPIWRRDPRNDLPPGPIPEILPPPKSWS